MDSSGSHKRSKSKSCKSSHALWDKWGNCKTSTKEPEYKKMCYLTFAPVMDLEQELFKKCSFNQPPMSYPSPLRASDNHLQVPREPTAMQPAGSNRVRAT